MKLTDYLAIWGAVISSIVACWTIYRDFLKRDRVKVSAGFRITLPEKQEVFVFDVRNLSSHKIRVTHCAGYQDDEQFIRRFPRFLRKYFRTSTKGFLFSFVPLSGPALPATIEPFDYQIFSYAISHTDFPTIGSLSIHTADDREWFVPTRDIRKIHADNTYKAIHASRQKT
jgi:hypothetical protein